jgi:hypothetical protein
MEIAMNTRLSRHASIGAALTLCFAAAGCNHGVRDSDDPAGIRTSSSMSASGTATADPDTSGTSTTSTATHTGTNTGSTPDMPIENGTANDTSGSDNQNPPANPPGR